MSWQTTLRTGAALLAIEAALVCRGGVSAGSESMAGAEDAVSRVNVHLHTIISGGHWCRGAAEEGFYRVVIYSGGWEEVYHHLYIQLLRVDPETHDVLIDRTRPVKEAQGLDLVFSDLKLVPRASAVCADALVEAIALRRTIDGQRAERFRMRITPAGDYQVSFEPAASAVNEK